MQRGKRFRKVLNQFLGVTESEDHKWREKIQKNCKRKKKREYLKTKVVIL